MPTFHFAEDTTTSPQAVLAAVDSDARGGDSGDEWVLTPQGGGALVEVTVVGGQIRALLRGLE